MANNKTEENTRRNRFTLLALALVFVLPLAYAFWVYRSMESPATTKNYGDLVHPARPIEQLSLTQLDGSSFGLDDLRGKWTLVYVGNGECDSKCAQALYKLRQSRMAQGENVRRIQRVYIMMAEAPADSLQTVLKEHDGMVVGRVDDAQRAGVLEVFKLTDQARVLQAGRVYIVDPLGNLMMSYSHGFDARGLIKDLQHLLKASQVG